MERKYKVKFFMDDNYEVISYRSDFDPFDNPEEYYEHEETEFQGSLSDCEAYIRLKKEGYM